MCVILIIIAIVGITQNWFNTESQTSMQTESLVIKNGDIITLRGGSMSNLCSSAMKIVQCNKNVVGQSEKFIIEKQWDKGLPIKD